MLIFGTVSITPAQQVSGSGVQELAVSTRHYANYVRVDKWNGSKWQNIPYSADDSYDIALTTDNNGSYVYNGVRYNIINGWAYRA